MLKTELHVTALQSCYTINTRIKQADPSMEVECPFLVFFSELGSASKCRQHFVLTDNACACSSSPSGSSDVLKHYATVCCYSVMLQHVPQHVLQYALQFVLQYV